MAVTIFGQGRVQAGAPSCVTNCSESYGVTLSTEQTTTPETWYQPSTSSGAKNVHGIRLLDTWSADPGKNLFVGGGFSPGSAETASSLIAVQFDLDYSRTGINSNYPDPDSSDNTALPNTHWSATTVPAFFNTSWTKSGDAAGTINNAEESAQFMPPSDGDASYYRIRSKIVDKDTTTFGSNLLSGCVPCNYSGTFTTGFEPNKAADGSVLTSWKTSNQSGAHAYWQVDFGAGNEKAVRRIQLSYPTGSTNIPNTKGGVHLLASNNGTDWTNIVSQPSTMTQVDNLYTPSFGALGSSVRYIRIQVIGNSGTGAAEFSEVTMSAATTQNDLRVNHRFKQTKPKVTDLQIGAQILEGSTATATSAQTITGKIGYQHRSTGFFTRQNEFYNLNSTADQMMTSALGPDFSAGSVCPVGTNQQCAQLFVPTQSTMKGVKFWASRGSAPLSGLRAEVRATSAGLPTTTVVGSAVVTSGSLRDTYINEAFVAFASPLTLTPGTTYALVFMPDAASNANDYSIAQNAGDFYTRGDSATHNGSTWTKQPNTDLGFITYSSITTESATIKLVDKTGAVAASNTATVNIDGTFSGSINLPIGMAIGKSWVTVDYSHGADSASLNQLANSSFETGTTIADSWLANASSSQAVQTYATAGLSEPIASQGIQWGSKVQRIVASGANAGIRQKNLLLWNSDRVSASGYVYTPSGQTGRTAQVCYSFDNDATYPRCSANIGLTAGGWTRVDHSTYLNTSTSSILNDPVAVRLIVTNSVNGDVYYFEGAQLSRQGLVENASFEYIENGDRGPDGWEGNTTTYCYDVNTNIPSLSAFPDSGQYSCRDNWTGGPNWEQTVDTNYAGYRHKATVKMYTTTTTAGNTGKITVNPADATLNAACGDITLVQDQWVTVTCEFTPTSGNFRLLIQRSAGQTYTDSVAMEVCRDNNCSGEKLVPLYIPTGEGQSFTVQDTTAPSTPGTPSTTNPTTDTTPTWTWTASSDAYGINNYEICWDTVAGGCANSSTSATNNFTHSTVLADNLWYFKVRAVDGNGVVSAYSGNGQTRVDTTNPSGPGTPASSSPTNDTTPSWTWSAATDGGSGIDHYEVCWDTASGGCTNTSTSATNSFTHSSALAPGTWYMKVRAVDVAGNTGAYSGNGQVVVDTTAPTTPGTPSTTTPTNDTTPVWTWTASTDASGIDRYDVCWDTVAGGCSNSSTAATNTFTHSIALAQNTWFFKVRALDVAGNTGAYSGNGQVVVDTTAPTTPGTPSTTNPTTDTTPTWSWTASSDASGIDHYEICWDTVAGGCTNTSTAATNTFTHSTALAQNTWHFKVRAVDAAGNTGAYSGVGQTLIDTTAPTVPGAPATSSPTSDTTPSWSWTASTDASSGFDHYEICWDTVAGGCTNSSTSTINNFTHSVALAAGTWYMKVRALDVAGNTSAYSANGQVVVDTTAPTTPGTPSTTTPTFDTTPVWTWTASTDGGSGLRTTNTYEVQWCGNPGFTGCGSNTDFSDTNSFTHVFGLSVGTWYLRTRAFDGAGNASAFSPNGSVDIQASSDTTPPTVPGTPSTTSPTADTTPAWAWTASTDDTGVDHYMVCWDTVVGGCTNIDTSPSNAYTHTVALADGTWYFKVRAVDQAGNSSAYSTNASVFVDATGPTTPGTPITTTPTTDTTPTWSWTASTDSGVGLNNYQLCWDTVNGGCANSANIGTNSFTHSVALAAGTWYFKVRGMDTLGNLGAYSASGTVLIDTTNPTTPGTPSTTSPTEDTTPTWSWTAATDSGSGLRSTNTYAVMWCTDSGFTANCGSAFSNTNSYTHTANLGLGTWYIRVRAYDAVDNFSSWSGTGSALVQDVTPPSVPGDPTTTTPTTDTTPTWSWSASTDSGSGVDHYELCWDTISGGCAYGANSTTNSFTHSTALAVGTWYFKVRALDVAGNASAYSQVGSVSVEAPPTSGGGGSSQPTPVKKSTPIAKEEPVATPVDEPETQPESKSTEKKPVPITTKPTETDRLVMVADILANPWMIAALLLLAGILILRRKKRKDS